VSIVPSHQTVRLARGKHAGPEAGVCVMELASMLADEPFSDHPPSVCPVIASYLRSYNDVVSDGARQDLLRLAADAVGSVGSAALQLARGERCVRELGDLHAGRSRVRRMLGPKPERRTPVSQPELERLCVHLAKQLWRAGPHGHARALALADDLVAMRDDGGSDRVQPPAPRPMVVV
jgi:hypothetical protein